MTSTLLALALAQWPTLNPTSGGTGSSPTGASAGAFGSYLTTEERPEVFLSFGYNVNTDLVVTAVDGGGSVTSSPPFAVVSSGDGGVASLSSRRAVRYAPGQGVSVRFTATWDTCRNGSRQVVGAGNTEDGFGFGCCPTCGADGGPSFGVVRRTGGVDYWTRQGQWNISTRSSLNTSYGSPYQISYQWLGFGQISYYVEDQASGAFSLVHAIKYANTSASTSIQKPTLPLLVETAGQATVRVPSMALIRQGPAPRAMAVRRQFGATKAAAIANRVSLFALYNEANYSDAGNRVQAIPDFLSIANAGNVAQTVSVYLVLSRRLGDGGVPTSTGFTTSGTQAVISTSTTAAVTGGRDLLRVVVEGGGTVALNLRDLALLLTPGELLSVETQSVSGTPNVTAAISWEEEF